MIYNNVSRWYIGTYASFDIYIKKVFNVNNAKLN